MPETVAVDGLPVAKEAGHRRASALAQHLDCSRTYIGKLKAEGVLQRQGDGFPLDQSRVAYLRFLRRERKQSPRSEADTDFQRAKAELIRLRIVEKQRQLIPFEEAAIRMDEMVGLLLTRLSRVRCAVRRSRSGDMSRHRQCRDSRSRDQAGRRTRRASTGCRRMMTDVEMTDHEARQQVRRADRFIAEFRETIAATVVDPASLCADDQRRGLRRIADTLDAVPFVTFCNLANINTAMRGGFMSVIEVHLMGVGAGPTLDFMDATAFLAGFETMIEKARKRRLQ